MPKKDSHICILSHTRLPQQGARSWWLTEEVSEMLGGDETEQACGWLFIILGGDEGQSVGGGVIFGLPTPGFSVCSFGQGRQC